MLFWKRKTLVTLLELAMRQRMTLVLYCGLLSTGFAIWFLKLYQPLVMQRNDLLLQLANNNNKKHDSHAIDRVEPLPHGTVIMLIEQAGCLVKQQQVKVRATAPGYMWLEYALEIDGTFSQLVTLCARLAEHAAYKMQQLTLHKTEQGVLQATIVLQAYEVVV